MGRFTQAGAGDRKRREINREAHGSAHAYHSSVSSLLPDIQGIMGADMPPHEEFTLRSHTALIKCHM